VLGPAEGGTRPSVEGGAIKGDGKGYAPGMSVGVGRGSSRGFSGSFPGNGFTTSRLSAATDCSTAGSALPGCLFSFGATENAVSDVTEPLDPSGLGVGGSASGANAVLRMTGDRLEGTVLLRCTPEPGGVPNAVVVGLGTAPERRECLDEVDTFLRIPPNFRMLSAAALEAAETERPSPLVLRLGVVGVRA
jgi:hypothetical protein